MIFRAWKTALIHILLLQLIHKKVFGKFVHTPQPKKFYIPPRYHDPHAEARENREQKAREELGIVDEKVDAGKPFVHNIKGQFRMAHGAKSKSSETARKNSNTRLIVLILTLAFIFYLFFYSDFLF